MAERAKILGAGLAAVSIVAVALSAYLSWASWNTEVIASCQGEAACDKVLSSHWSRWLGLPVSLFGLVTYLGILATLWPTVQKPAGWAGTALLSLALLAIGAAAWFVFVQWFWLHSFCPFCMTIHACGLVVCCLAFWLVCFPEEEADYDRMRALLGVAGAGDASAAYDAPRRELQPLVAITVATLGLGLLMGGQVFFAPASVVVEAIEAGEQAVAGEQAEEEQPEEFSFSLIDDRTTPTDGAPQPGEAPTEEFDLFGADLSVEEPARQFQFRGLDEKIDASQYPVLGNPEAPTAFLEMLDYTCSHCREFHEHILDTLKRYDGQVAIVIYHVPLDPKCNPHVPKDAPRKKPTKGDACEYARLAIGVVQLAPDRFAEYHDWMMQSKEPPLIHEARREAVRLAGQAIILDESLREATAQKIQRHCDALKALGGGLPLLLTGKGAIRGVPDQPQEWYQLLETHFDLKPPAEVPQ